MKKLFGFYMFKSCTLHLWASLYILAQTISASSVHIEKQNYHGTNLQC